MKKNIVKDISASTIQILLNQLLGLFIFIIISRYLVKNEYGELNWSIAILTFFVTLLSLRLEQIIVRRVAAGEDVRAMFTLSFGHTFFSGIFFYILLFLLSLIFPAFFERHQFLLILAVSQLISYVASSFKQIVNGKEFYRLLAVMSTVSNLIRALWLLLAILFSELSMQLILTIYIVSALAELMVNYCIVRYLLHIRAGRWILKDYFVLLGESLPQIASVILNACIARIDWILLGIFSGALITAEYSFAYRVFELCPFPLLIAGPILLSRFSKYLSQNSETTLIDKKRELSFFIRYEMIAATCIPLLLNIIWSPLVDLLTNNKYGAVNKINFFVLTLSLPFQYMNNLFWTIEFAQNRLNRIFRITACVCTVIIIGNLLMIPLLDSRGAAIVYLAATITEYMIYMRVSVIGRIKECWQSLCCCIAIALISGLTFVNIVDSVFAQVFLSAISSLLLLIITKQMKADDLQIIKEWFHETKPDFIQNQSLLKC